MTLLEDARAGDEEAFMELFLQYRPIVFKLQGIYFVKDFDCDDWLQEGLIAFSESLTHYDEKIGVTLGAYFKRNFDNCIKSHLRKQAAYKRKSQTDAVPFETSLADEQLIVAEALEDLRDQLSPLEELAFTAYIVGHDFETIAAYANQSPKKVKLAYERARRKIIYHLKN